jgi:hypothetical protein
MRSIVVLAILLIASTAVGGDLERPNNAPCTCIRPSDISVERLGKAPRDEHAGWAESRLRKSHDRHLERCLRDNKADEVEVVVRFARGAELPKLHYIGSKPVTACLANLTWTPMIAAPKAVTYRFRVALRSARR